MNTGTIIRTILVVATCFNSALMATDVAQFNNPTVDLVYRVLSIIANFIIVFCATYFNQDYTAEGAVGTGYTRALKAGELEIVQNEVGVEDIEDLDCEDYEEIEEV